MVTGFRVRISVGLTAVVRNKETFSVRYAAL